MFSSSKEIPPQTVGDKLGHAFDSTVTGTENFAKNTAQGVSNLACSGAEKVGEVYDKGVDKAGAAVDSTKKAIIEKLE